MKKPTRTPDHLKTVGGVFIAIVVLQLAMAAFSIELLSAVRAYVAGESLYSKGQKDALLHLQSYVLSHSEADYRLLLQALVVPEGDAQARRALQATPADREAARHGFLAGQNDPGDVDGMVYLFAYGHAVPFMARAIRIWSEGDAAVAELRTLVNAAHSQILLGKQSAPEVNELATRTPELNAQLSRLEREFTDQLGQAARLVQRWLLAMNVLIAATLTAMGGGYIRKALREQRQKEVEMTELVGAVGDAVLTVDAEHNVVLFNPAAAAMFGCSALSARGSAVQRFIQSGLPVRADRLPPGATGSVVELTGLHADGRTLHLEASLAPLNTTQGLHTTIVCRDVTARKEALERDRSQLLRRNSELARKAYTDALTGLPNREALEQHLVDALAAAQQGAGPFCVLFLDLDGFKSVNDAHGHLVGDELLKLAAERLRDASRHRDQVFRVSGDEFVLVVTEDVTPAATEALLQRLLATIREPYRLGDITARVTVSVGVANFPDNGVDARSLLLAADASMYLAKQNGKDGYRIGDSVSPMV